MADFRYAQFCPLARAAEILAERWTLLVLRELWLGPQRFSDLRRRLPGVSTSVLAERLERLERRGLVARRLLPPPAASTVYELGEAGRALEPAMTELVRWGVRFLASAEPGDHYEPDWVRLALRVFARRERVPEASFELRTGEDGAIVVRVVGGPEGTRVEDGPGPAEVRVEASPLVLLGLLSGRLRPAEALRTGRCRVDGDPAALEKLPALFRMAPDVPEPKRASQTTKGVP